MGLTSTISSKGQITVPVEVRRRLGLNEGDRVKFSFEEGTTVLRPVRGEQNPFTKWIGALSTGEPGGSAVQRVRDMRNDEFGGPGDETDR